MNYLLFIELFSPREHVLRGNVRTIETDLKVAVVAGGTARAAHIADELALLDGLARADGQGQAVCIHGAVAAAVVDDDRVAIARARTGLVVTRLGDGAACGGVDGRTRRCTDVHAPVAVRRTSASSSGNSAQAR